MKITETWAPFCEDLPVEPSVLNSITLALTSSICLAPVLPDLPSMLLLDAIALEIHFGPSAFTRHRTNQFCREFATACVLALQGHRAGFQQPRILLEQEVSTVPSRKLISNPTVDIQFGIISQGTPACSSPKHQSQCASMYHPLPGKTGTPLYHEKTQRVTYSCSTCTVIPSGDLPHSSYPTPSDSTVHAIYIALSLAVLLKLTPLKKIQPPPRQRLPYTTPMSHVEYASQSTLSFNDVHVTL